jgi:hypothetical protein
LIEGVLDVRARCLPRYRLATLWVRFVSRRTRAPSSQPLSGALGAFWGHVGPLQFHELRELLEVGAADRFGLVRKPKGLRL